METPIKMEGITRSCPLFERFPKLAGRIPWIALGRFPVPMQRLEKLGRNLGLTNLWIMREDKSGELYGGNKVRKLEFTMADARSKNREIVLTFGGTGSNHVLATTIYARSLGMKTIAVLAPQPVTDHVVKNIRAYAHYGARIMLLDNKTDFAKIMVQYPKRLIPRTYFLPLGGSNALGVLGSVNAAFEIRERIDSGKLPNLKQIWVAVGSGGTAAGLLLGKRLAGLDAEIKGVRVATPTMVNDFTVSVLANRAAKLLRRIDDSVPEVKFAPRNVGLLTGYLGPGYGHVTEDAQRAMDMMELLEEIELEGTYTGKALGALMRNMPSDPAEPIMYMHTLNSVDVYKDIPDDVDMSRLPERLRKIADSKK